MANRNLGELGGLERLFQGALSLHLFALPRAHLWAQWPEPHFMRVGGAHRRQAPRHPHSCTVLQVSGIQSGEAAQCGWGSS